MDEGKAVALAREDVGELWDLQCKAYALLVWLADEANRDPDILSLEAVALLTDPVTTGRWLSQYLRRFPVELALPTNSTAFANLLSSFFSTSFHVRHLYWNGRLLEARLTVGHGDDHSGAGLHQCQKLALKHLASSRHLPITDRESGEMVALPELRLSLLLWTYIWELDRRAHRKGKGTVVHRIWRAMPKETRKSLTAGRIWEARERLVAVVREHCNQRTG